MARYHINPKTGNANICSAQVACPYADDDGHYDSRADAMQSYEDFQQGNLPSVSKKNPNVKKAKLGSYAIDCPNDKCKTVTHDLRNPEKYLACAKIAAGSSNAKATLYSARYKQAVDACMRDYFVADLRKAEQRLRTMPENEEVLNALRMLEYYRTSGRPFWLPNNNSNEHLATNLSHSYRIARNSQKVKSLTNQMGRSKSRGSSATAVEVIPRRPDLTGYRPKPKLEQMSMKEIYQELATEKEKAERVITFQLEVSKSRMKRFFGAKDNAKVVQIKHTKRYEEIQDYISLLPPKSKEIAFLYQTVVDQDHNDKALDRIDEAFVKTRAVEVHQARSEASQQLTETVDKMLKGIETKGSLEI